MLTGYGISLRMAISMHVHALDSCWRERERAFQRRVPAFSIERGCCQAQSPVSTDAAFAARRPMAMSFTTFGLPSSHCSILWNLFQDAEGCMDEFDCQSVQILPGMPASLNALLVLNDIVMSWHDNRKAVSHYRYLRNWLWHEHELIHTPWSPSK